MQEARRQPARREAPDEKHKQEPRSDIDPVEQEEAERRSALRAHVVHEAIRQEGQDELERPPAALAWSGLAAGLSMGFSLVAEGLVRSHLPDAPWRPLLTHLGYSVGFLLVVLGRQQLFTENTLTVIIPLLHDRTASILCRVLRLWAIVLAANVLGALLFAFIAGKTGLFPAEVRHAFGDIGREALTGDFWTVTLRGIFAGWLIALMVWTLPAAETARVPVIVILTYLVALGGFSHVIAGSVEVLYLVTTGSASWGQFFGQFFAPTVLGNVIGGVSLVAALNHAQVMAGGGQE